MMPATSENEKVRFHTLNRATQNRVVSRYVEAVTGKEVREEDEVKGYERGEGDYVILENDELENVRSTARELSTLKSLRRATASNGFGSTVPTTFHRTIPWARKPFR